MGISFSNKDRVVVASYNVHQCVGMDGRRDPARIAKVVAAMGVDIIGLQEVSWRSEGRKESHQMDYLAEALGFRAVAGPTLERPDGSYGNALLTNRRILECRRIDLSVPNLEPRGALDADVSNGDRTLRVIVTHLGLRASERRRQVRRLLDILSEETNSRQGTILLGDVNEWLPMGRPLRWLRRHFGTSVVLRTFPSWMPIFALDRIWILPKKLLLKIGVHKTQLSVVASDHLPVKAILRVPSPREGHHLESDCNGPTREV